jgi:hypothetical protein
MDGIRWSSGSTEETVAPLRNGFYVPGILSVISQGIPQLANSNPEAAVKIDESVSLPDAALDFGPRNQVSSVFQEDYEQAKRLLLQSYPFTLFE